MPIVAIEPNLLGIELSAKAPRSLRISMALEAQDGEIRSLVVARVIIDMMYLNPLT
jgi:hypothetical protein